jgi:hypothetical protein
VGERGRDYCEEGEEIGKLHVECVEGGVDRGGERVDEVLIYNKCGVLTPARPGIRTLKFRCMRPHTVSSRRYVC